MTDNELLLAISSMLDEKLDEKLDREIGALRSEIKSDISEVKQDIAEVKQDIAEIKQDIAEVKHDVLLLKLDNENNIIPRLKTIEACYVSTYDRYKNSVEGYEAMQEDIKLLKQVVSDHSEKLQKIS